MEFILQNFRNNVKELNLLSTKPNIINQIKLDENDNYTPYLFEYDLYNITSSSDNVRIILSYYLALLQTAVELKGKTNFPNLLILDEPRQQNLDEEDLKNFISLLDKVENKNCQVLLTTYSENKKESYEYFKPYIVHEMANKQDKLLKRLSN